MKIIFSDIPILKCNAYTLLVPCSKFGTIKPESINSNYKAAVAQFTTHLRKALNPTGEVLKCSEYGYPNCNFLCITGLVVLNYSHEKCDENTLKYFEKSLYTLSKSSDFQYKKDNIGMFSLEEWVKEDYIPLCLDLLEKYLGKSVNSITMYK